jgi:hypothetical protein
MMTMKMLCVFPSELFRLITKPFLIYVDRFSTAPIRGTDKFTDQKGWGDDVLFNFQEYCREQFEIPGLRFYLLYKIQE